ncbi:MAG: hypothetical protein Q7R35_08130 [Elusimicrobiota bacterium]|nr:hypothetical protein [Elusimicrobiota bacterium]
MTGNLPTFLPPILALNGAWDEILTRLYDVFEKDFKKSQVYHQGIKVIFNNVIKPDGQGKEEGFWHVVTKEDKKTGDRLIDFDRARRLPWAEPMLRNYPVPEIKVWQYQEGPADKGMRTYVWLENFDYALILQRRKHVFLWITAFYVQPWKKVDLQRRYEKMA